MAALVATISDVNGKSQLWRTDLCVAVAPDSWLSMVDQAMGQAVHVPIMGDNEQRFHKENNG